MPIVLYLGAILLFLIGLYGVILHRNMMRILLSLSLMESATFLMLIVQGFRRQATAPIFSGAYGSEIIPGVTHVVDPIVQALTLTSIVISVATLSMALALIIQLARHYRTLDVRRLRNLRG
jgi:multisubunit Na+/H+ antiporter MnhC subunit